MAGGEAVKTRDDRKPNDLEAEVDDLTEKLKTAMASGGKIESSLGRCSSCKEEISEKSVLVGEETYHEGCFVCSVCSIRLTGRYYQVSGQYYCEVHYKEVSLPRCAGCHQHLTAEFLTVTGQYSVPTLAQCSDLLSRPVLPPGLLPLQCLQGTHQGQFL